MKRMMIVAVIGLTGCQVHHGFDASKIPQLEIGATTEDQAVALLGSPIRRVTMSGGFLQMDVLTFVSKDSDHSPTAANMTYTMLTRSNVVPTITRTLTLTFDPTTKILNNVTLSETNSADVSHF